MTITGSALFALVASGCLVSTKATGKLSTGSGTGTGSSTTVDGKPGPRVVPKPASGMGGIVRDWRSGLLGSAASFSIEPSLGPIGTVVNIYGTFRPAFSGGAVMCMFNGAKATSPYFVSLRRMVVRVPEGSKSGKVDCKVGSESLWSGQFVVTNEADVAATDEQQGVLGAVYKIPAGTTKVPNFSSLGNPIGTFVVPVVHTSPRPIARGFLGANTFGESVRDWYAIRYVGLVDATREADYTFKVKSSDGAKLYIDDKLVVDNDGVHGVTEKEGTVKMTQGKHRIVVEYFKSTGGEIALELWWKRGVNPFSGVAKHALSRYSVEYDCTVQPKTAMCCKAMTPACQMCGLRQKAVLDAWRGQCVKP